MVGGNSTQQQTYLGSVVNATLEHYAPAIQEAINLTQTKIQEAQRAVNYVEQLLQDSLRESFPPNYATYAAFENEEYWHAPGGELNLRALAIEFGLGSQGTYTHDERKDIITEASTAVGDAVAAAEKSKRLVEESLSILRASLYCNNRSAAQSEAAISLKKNVESVTQLVQKSEHLKAVFHES